MASSGAPLATRSRGVANYQSMKASAKAGVSGFHIKSMMMLVLVPWTNFACVALAFSFRSVLPTAFPWILFSFLVVLVLMWLSVHAKNKSGGPFYMFLGVLSGLALIFGGWIGLFTSGTSISMWASLHGRQTYTNVQPTDIAESKQDGGLISFTQDARIDFSKVLGKISENGHVYCVAPVFDDSQQNMANFWAVGVDCCLPRSNFMCDDARDPTAKSGAVVFDAGESFGRRDSENFKAAVRQARVFYGLSTPDAPVFVNWVKDPEAWVAAQWVGGALWLGTAMLVYLVFSAILGGLLHGLSPRYPVPDPAAGGKLSA